MKKLSQDPAKTFEKLRAAALPAGYIKIERDGFMPLYAELIHDAYSLEQTRELWAVAHTYVQNGDLMRDPEIVFLRAKFTNQAPEWYPVEYRQDPYTLQQLATLDGALRPVSFALRPQREVAAFCTQWARNLVSQGFTSPRAQTRTLELVNA